MPEPETILTYVMFVDEYDRLLDKIPVAPTRRHHIEHPDMIPAQAVACQYYDIRSWRDPFSPLGTRHNTSFNFSGFIRVARLAHARSHQLTP